jgi:hypothetical protein
MIAASPSRALLSNENDIVLLLCSYMFYLCSCRTAKCVFQTAHCIEDV